MKCKDNKNCYVSEEWKINICNESCDIDCEALLTIKDMEEDIGQEARTRLRELIRERSCYKQTTREAKPKKRVGG